MSNITSLDSDMLLAYEQRLRAQGVPVDQWRIPGLTSAEIETTMAPLGLSLPIEARTWWEWNNGATLDGRVKLFGPYIECFSLEGAVRQYEKSRGVAQRAAEDDLPPPWDNPDTWWVPTWFPIVNSGHTVTVDCSVSSGQPTPIRYIDWTDVEGFFEPRAQSLGQMIALWISAIDTGAWKFDPAQNDWEINREFLDPKIGMTPLV
jgi:hypothetical protein